MKTLDSIIDELVQEFNQLVENDWQKMSGGDLIDVDQVKWLRTALREVAEETVEATKVPEILHEINDEAVGWNGAVSGQQKLAHSWLHGGEKQV